MSNETASVEHLNGLIDQVLSAARELGVSVALSYYPANQNEGEYLSASVSRYEVLRREGASNDPVIPF